jgi:hypothetical protein
MTSNSTNRTEQILAGKLLLPESIAKHLDRKSLLPATKLWNSLWRQFITNKKPSAISYHSDQWPLDTKSFVILTKHLSKSGWCIINMQPKRNWGDIIINEEMLLKYVSVDELEEVRASIKLRKYQPTASKSEDSDITRINGARKTTGLVRDGFAIAGNTEFKYDIDAIKANRFVITKQALKSMDKVKAEYGEFLSPADYNNIITTTLDNIIANPDKTYTTGTNHNDSRGRAISTVLGKVFNPISSKEARSCLILTDETSVAREIDTTHIYLFIAELLGSKPTTIQQKEQYGMTAYIERKLPKLNPFDEDDRKDWHENIWLTRLYDELDSFYAGTLQYWTVPIELDGTASMLQVTGVLLNDQGYTDTTNVTNSSHLKDVWTIPGLKRQQVKYALTPKLYGSSASTAKLWTKNKVEYTTTQLIQIETELRSGQFALANKFKDFIIDNVVPKQTQEVRVWNEVFTVECNHYRQVSEYVKPYVAWDSTEDLPTTIHHTITKKVPDLERFKLYFQTLLVHNLDSQIANSVCSTIQQLIPIHDAFIVSPNRALETRKAYAHMLDLIYADREEILHNYFKSIGIHKTAMYEFHQLLKLVTPHTNFKAQLTALK